ncbi:MAG: UvrD-helicase domain-containing protein [Chloroflexi bacterium]|nr:UvrD-helicase domain-containing protein [Chloroflexota bacterium]
MAIHPLLEGLNAEQQRAVTASPGPIIVVAGPGSGKTRVLTHRIAWYVHERAIPASRILAVTFTNKAAKEMQERVRNLLSSATLGAEVRTFHSLCARILRQEFAHTQFSANYLIYDTVDQRAAIKQAITEANITQEQYSPNFYLKRISAAKNQLQTSREFFSNDYFGELVSRVYPHYERLLARNDARDFDDLLLHTVHLFQQNPTILQKYRRFFPHILIDEFQDTNFAQYRLVQLLAPAEPSLFVVGDPNQAIYRFRGADYRNLIRLRADHPSALEITLFRNYRSPQFVLDLASSLINHNPQTSPLRLLGEQPKAKTKPQAATLVRTLTDEEEANFVAEKVLDHVQGGGKLQDCAVMYRTNAQSRALETAFTRQDIPYQLIGGVSFYRRQEVRDILAYLRFLDNPRDTVSLERIINTPRRGIGEKTFHAFHLWTVKHRLNYGAALELLSESEAEPTERESPLPTSEKPSLPPRKMTSSPDTDRNSISEEGKLPDADAYNVQQFLAQSLSPVGKKNLLRFAHQVNGWRALVNSASVGNLFRTIVDDIHYWDHLAKISDTEAQRQDREENLEELERYLFDHPDLALSEFLLETTLVSDVDELDDRRECATLQTLHTAKGLEYPVVFIIGLVDGILPHSFSLQERDGVEEERRLFYVGITRSMNQLYLCYFGLRGAHFATQSQSPSRFLAELPVEFLVNEKGEPIQSLNAKHSTESSSEKSALLVHTLGRHQKRNETSRQKGEKRKFIHEAALAKKKPPLPAFSTGTRVRHKRFGSGIIIAMEQLGELDLVLTIDFDDRQFGEKRLIASRAQLSLLP